MVSLFFAEDSNERAVHTVLGRKQSTEGDFLLLNTFLDEAVMWLLQDFRFRASESAVSADSASR